MEKFKYNKPSLEEADFGKFVAGASIQDGTTEGAGSETPDEL